VYVAVVTVAEKTLLLYEGNEDDSDDDDVENDGVFQIPDAVFGLAGCQTTSAAVNGEFSCMLDGSQ